MLRKLRESEEARLAFKDSLKALLRFMVFVGLAVLLIGLGTLIAGTDGQSASTLSYVLVALGVLCCLAAFIAWCFYIPKLFRFWRAIDAPFMSFFPEKNKRP